MWINEPKQTKEEIEISNKLKKKYEEEIKKFCIENNINDIVEYSHRMATKGGNKYVL